MQGHLYLEYCSNWFNFQEITQVNNFSEFLYHYILKETIDSIKKYYVMLLHRNNGIKTNRNQGISAPGLTHISFYVFELFALHQNANNQRLRNLLKYSLY